MADIAWTGYALQMFTAEQREAATQGLPDPTGNLGGPIPVVPPTVSGGSSTGLPIRITGPGIPASGYDPNNPTDLNKLWELGWRFEAGRWIAPGSPGVPATPDQVLASSGGRAPGSLASVSVVSSIAGGSVLGVTVPGAPAVALPSWVGGRIGHVVRSGGTRPESGGQLRIVKGEGHKYPWTNVVK